MTLNKLSITTNQANMLHEALQQQYDAANLSPIDKKELEILKGKIRWIINSDPVLSRSNHVQSY